MEEAIVITPFKEGDKVRYCPSHGREEKGIVKSNPENGKFVFVVYKCNNEWHNYKNYTGCATDIEDLKIGW